MAWEKEQHGYTIQADDITLIEGVVPALSVSIQAFTQEGDAILVNTPLYPPFTRSIKLNNRKVVTNSLVEQDGRFTLDFEQLEQDMINNDVKLYAFCSPHNPGGRVWCKEELVRVAELCRKHHVILVSDEIHQDLTLFGHQHHSINTVGDYSDFTVILTSATKTFNIAGIITSHAIVPNKELRDRFFGWLKANELDEAHIFAHIATVAAFRKGEEWRRQMLAYVEDNIRFVEDYCREHIPGIRPLRPQASFLVWLDCRDLQLSHEALLDLFIDKAHLALNDGEMFGPGGEGFMRLNVGSPREYIRQALEKLAKAVKAL